MVDFTIREALDEDGPSLAELFEHARPDEAPLPPPEGERFERPARYFVERGGRLWVVMREHAVAGSLGLLARGVPGEYELSMICLDAEARGQGFATALLAGANAYAAASGGERLSVWVDVRLDDVHLFCERHGFVREPGTRARADEIETLECRFARDVEV